MAEEIEDKEVTSNDEPKKAKKKPAAKKKTKADKEDIELVKNSIEINPKLDEAKGETVVLGWGRMNPVTIGHEKLANKLKAVAKKNNATPLMYLTHTQNSKKDPLSYNDKIMLAKKAFGNIVQKSTAKTIIQAMQELQKKFSNLILVVGSDRVGEFDTLLNKYNGKDYSFDSIKIVSAGERDADADGVEGMSASKMREAAVKADNINATWVDSKGKKQPSFKSGLPKKLQRDAQAIWDMVRGGLKLAEELELDEAVLSLAQRRQRAITMRKYKAKIAVARKRASRKAASADVIKKRARKKAIQLIKKQIAGAKGKSYDTLSAGEKMQIDKRVAKRKSAIERIAKRLITQVRRTERERLSATKKSTNEEFEIFFETVEMAKKPRYHKAQNKNGSVKLDGRFKIFRKQKDSIEEDMESDISRMKDVHARQRKQLSVRHERELDQLQTSGLRKQIRKVQTTNQVKQEETDIDELFSLIEEVSNDIVASIELEETKIYESLKAKAEKHNVDFEVVWEKYQTALDEEPKSGLTHEQHAFATVNSFLANEAATPMRNLKLINKIKKSGTVKTGSMSNKKEMKEWVCGQCNADPCVCEGDEFDLDEAFIGLSEDAMLDKALAAIHKHVLAGVGISDIAFDVSRAKGVTFSAQDLRKAYEKKYGAPKKAVNVAVRNKLMKKYSSSRIREAYGDMDRGTPSLTKKYMQDTPFQPIDKSIVKAKDGSYTYKESVNEEFETLLTEAQCDLVGMKMIKEFEKFVDRMFEKFGIDFNFTKHFADRMGDERNNPCITMKELASFITKIYKNQGKSLKGVSGAEAVVKDLQTDLNIPVAVKYDEKNDEFDVVMKTIMRKKNFKTPNKVIGYK